MKIKGSRRLIRQLGLALAVAALAAPAAQAMPMVSSEDYGTASQARLYADDMHSITPVPGKPGNYEPINTQARPDLVPVNRVVPADATGFDWNDAGIGVVTAFGVMLLGGAILLAGRHSRKSRLAAA